MFPQKNSWIIFSRETGKPVFETWQATTTQKINTTKYEVFTAYGYLCQLNATIKAGKL
jgi:hypothetical protein